MINKEAIEQIVYIGLGSNLADPAYQIKTARLAIRQLDAVREIAFSSLYRSLPMGPQNQPDYVNAVMAISTRLSAINLLRNLQAIEHSQGRVRKGEHWGARTLDLDILLYADQQIHVKDLIVPHIGMAERAFVLYPLCEIAPEIDVPGRGNITDLLANCPADGLERIE
jgi:2-amino-4-hydroxy-6-hydroxymethyldihydropteridine diphosphokinase